MAITQTQILQLTMAMFKATPGAYVNNDLLAAAAAGMSITDMANTLATKSAFNEVYPLSMTDAAFSYVFINDLVGSNVSQANKDWAVQAVADKLAAGSTRAEAIWWAAESLAAISTTDPEWGAAAQQFANKVEVSEYYTVTRAQGTDQSTLAELQAPAASVTADAASVTAAKNVIDHVGSTYALTTSTTYYNSTTLNDTFDGSTANSLEGRKILDPSTTDNDTLNATLTAALTTATTVTNVENININWNGFGTATIAADNITGATISGTSSKTGFLGNFTVTGAGENNISAGAGMVGTLTVSDIENSTVSATKSTSIVVDGDTAWEDTVVVNAGDAAKTVTAGGTTQFGTATVTGGAATTTITVDADTATVTGGAATKTVTVTAQTAGTTASTATVEALAATAVNLDGTAATTDVANVTLGVSATLTTGATTEIETVNVTAADGTKVTLGAGSEFNTLAVTSTGAVQLASVASLLAGETVTNSTTGGLEVVLDHDGAADLSKVSATQFTQTTSHGSALTFATGATVVVNDDVTLNGGASYVGKSATTGKLNLTVQNDQTNDIAVTTLKTLNLTVTLNADDADSIATLGGITSANDVNLTSADDVVVTALLVKNLDASSSTGKLTVAQNFATTDLVSFIGSAGVNNVTLHSVDAATSVVTGDANDTVILGTASALADVTLVLGNGNNTVTAGTNGIKSASLSIVTGTGNDAISVLVDGSAADTNFVAELGDGTNTVTLKPGAGGNAQNSTIVTGAGTDTVTFAADTTADDTISWTAGAGTNTLKLAGYDISSGSITLSEVTHIYDNDGAGIVDGNLLKGQTYTIQGNGSLSTQLDVVIGTAGSYNFSGLVLDATLTKGIGGLDITAAAGSTIIATSGADIIDGSAGGANTFTGGVGSDSMTGGAGVDTFVIYAGDATKTVFDKITSFTTTADKLKTGTAGSATNYSELDGNFADAGSDAANLALAVTDAETLFNGTVQFAFIFNTAVGAATNGYLIADNNLDGTADLSIILVGLDAAADFAFGDIIA